MPSYQLLLKYHPESELEEIQVLTAFEKLRNELSCESELVLIDDRQIELFHHTLCLNSDSSANFASRKQQLDTGESLLSTSEAGNNAYVAKKQEVLVVDGSRTLQTDVRKILSGSCFEAVQAKSGKEALEMLSECTQVVILDQRLSGMGALECLKQMRSKRPNLPVIIVSDDMETQQIYDVQRMGISDFMAKPIEGEYLLRSIERAILLRVRRKSA